MFVTNETLIPTFPNQVRELQSASCVSITNYVLIIEYYHLSREKQNSKKNTRQLYFVMIQIICPTLSIKITNFIFLVTHIRTKAYIIKNNSIYMEFSSSHNRKIHKLAKSTTYLYHLKESKTNVVGNGGTDGVLLVTE